MMRRSLSTDFSQSDFQTSIENFPLPTNKSLVIDRRLESNSDPTQATHTPTRKASLSSSSANGKTPGPLLPPSPADSTMATSSPVRSVARSQRYSVGGAIVGDAASDKDSVSIMRNIDRGAPGDKGLFSETKSSLQREVAKKKSQYYQDVFAQRETTTSARDRVGRESIVMADVRTNVIVQDEYTFITDLSYTLSSRYARPENSICVSITHSACLLFGGSFEPAYTMTITALPSLVQPTTNKRNAALLAKSMEDVLGVPAQRGLIRFTAIGEENLATNGRTVLGEIEALERESNEDLQSSGLKNSQGGANVNDLKWPSSKKEAARADVKNKGRRASVKSLKNLKTGKGMDKLEVHGAEMTPPLSGITETSGNSDAHGKGRASGNDTSAGNAYDVKLPNIPTEKSDMDRRAEKAQKLGKRKSFIAAVFGKS